MSKAIEIKNLTKKYNLYDDPKDRLKETFHPLRKKYYQEFYALRDVSFSVEKGETVGIVGKNGSGKSTLLKLITGVLQPTSGSAEVHGHVSALLELGAGFNPEFTGWENVYFNGAILGYSRGEMEAKINDIIDFADIGPFLHQPVKTYSSGMFARLAFAVAINVEPDILIVDEVLSVGDVAFQRKCFARMEQLRAAGKTILFVSHTQGSIVDLCNHALLIDAGEKILEGDPKHVINNYLKLGNLKGDDYLAFRRELLAEYGQPSQRPITEKAQAPIGRAGQESSPGILPSAADESFYVENFVPQSCMDYGQGAVEILDVKITTPDGRKVNHLVNGLPYMYVYTVRFLEDIERVSFGMLIKTLQGVELGGGVFPPDGTERPSYAKGQEAEVKWRFDCFLEEGVYLTNCGIRSMNNGEVSLALRLLDAYMFKVLPRRQRISTGMINFGVTAEVTAR